MKIYKLTRDQLKKLQAGETISVNGVQYTYEDSAVYLPIDGESTYTLQNDDYVVQLYKDNAVVSEIEINNVPHAVKADNATQLKGEYNDEILNYNYIKNGLDSIPTKVSQLANDSNFTSNKGTVTGAIFGNAVKTPRDDGILDLGTISGNEIQGSGINSLVSNPKAVGINPAINGAGNNIAKGGWVKCYLDDFLVELNIAAQQVLFDGINSSYLAPFDIISYAKNTLTYESTKTYKKGDIVRNTSNTGFTWYRSKVNNNTGNAITVGSDNTYWEFISSDTGSNAHILNPQKFSTITLEIKLVNWAYYENGVSLYWRTNSQHPRYLTIEKWDDNNSAKVADVVVNQDMNNENITTVYLGSQGSAYGQYFRFIFRGFSDAGRWSFCLCQMAFTGNIGGIEGTTLMRCGGREYSSMYGELLPYITNNINLGNSSYAWNGVYGKTIYENGKSLSSLYQPKGNYLTSITKDQVVNALGYTPLQNHQDISGKQDKLTTAQLNAVNSGITSDKVKTYDGYHDNIGSLNSALSNQTQRIGALEGKPGLDKVGTITSINNQTPDNQGNIALNIPSPVSEATVSGWGFTKNTGTYSKPSGGIPKTDLASAVQTSLTNADNAVKKVKINGAEKSPTSGIVDLGNILPNIVLTTNTGMFASSMTFTQATGNEIFAAITKLGLKVGSHFMLNDGTANWANATIYSLSSTSCTFRATLFDAAQIRLYNFTVNNNSSGNSIAFSYLLPPVSSYNESTRNPVAGQTIYSDLAKKVNTSTTIAGKALTDNISASALRTALNVEDGANKIIVDENFNEDSPNPVQNKTITKMFSNFIGVKLIGPNNTSVETDLMHLNRVVNIDESIYTQLINLHHLYMANGAPCNIYIYLSDKIFAFAGANNSVFDFISLYDKGINEADIYLLRIFDNNTAVITSVQNQFDSKYAAQSALANYVSRNSSETINGTKTFAEDVIFNNTLKGQGDTACIKLNSSVGQDATTLEIYPDGTFGFLFANGDMGDYFKLPSIYNPDYDKDDPYILATTSDIRGSYEVFKRTNMTSTSYSTNWTIKSNITLPAGAKLVMQISSGPYNTSADNMVNKSVFIWNIPINWNNNQTTENFQTETTTSSYNGSISIDGGVSISFSIYQGKTDIIVKGRNANSTPGKVEFWTYK